MARESDRPDNEHGDGANDGGRHSSSGGFGRGREGGWTLRRRTPGGVLYARFTINGAEIERSTGKRDRRAARPEAARIYAAELARPRPKRSKIIRRGTVQALETLVAEWLASLETTHAAGTRKTWELYAGTHWIPFFDGPHNLTEERCGDYIRTRLSLVRATTVRKERTALVSFLEWAEDAGELPHVKVPRLPKRAMGTPHPVRRRVAAVELSPEQTLALIAALPEWSTSRKVTPFAVRGRFEVAYETSLRPSTLDRIEAPDHYRAGESLLRLSDDTDKARWGRDVPLTERARAALDAVLARHGEGYTGPIFGEHDYTTHIRRAAFQVLPRELAERFCGAHLRSATITHLLERPHASLPGVQHMAGHKLTSTTSRYVRPSLRAARETIDRPTADAPTEKK